jgi:chemotaxis protein CheD
MTGALAACVAVPMPPSATATEVSRSAVYLQPGQILLSTEPVKATTILGSCVAVCLWDRRLRLGGVNHYLLPHRLGNGQLSPRFGNVAIQQLVDGLAELGSQRRNLEAKIFGGAGMFRAHRDRDDHLGAKNVDLARSLLREHGIPLVAEDVGGRRGRKLIFHTDSGDAWVRPV